MFDLEKAVSEWRRRMGADPTLEPGQIAEIESHLRDKIDDLIRRGRSFEDAFKEAVGALGDPDLLGAQFFKVYASRRSGRPSGQPPRWVPALAWSYLRTGLRFVRRHKSFALLNVSGLTLGMLTFLLIMAWARNELSYDRFHENKDRLFMVLSRTGDGPTWNTTTYALPPALKAQYPEVEDYARVWPWHGSLVRYRDVRFEEHAITLTDPGFFRMFSFPFIKGSPETALADKHSIVLTETAARRYFGDADPVGKSLSLAAPGEDFRVTGVVRDVPSNSSLRFDMVARVEWLGEERLARWTEYVGLAYVQLKPGVTAGAFNPRIAGILREHSLPEWKDVPVLQPFAKSYLYANGRPGIIVRVVLFSWIAVLILLMACVNFMNLSTVLSAQRAGEVGLRKTFGAGRAQVARQFFAEALLLAAASMILAISIAPLVQAGFNRLAGKEVPLFGADTVGLFALLAVATVATGLLAGSYPAFLLSSFRPVEILRRKPAPMPGGAAFRKILIVLQFAAAVVLILGALVVSRQLGFVRSFDLGFNRDHVVTIENNLQILRNMDVFKRELAGRAGILNVAFAAQRPLDVGQTIRVDWEGNPDPLPAPIGYTMVDYEFFETFEMKIVRGRAFSRDFAADATESCVINEAAARMFGWEDPIGKTLTWAQGAIDPSLRNVRIVGVVRDFYDRSLRSGIRPFIFRIYPDWFSYIFIKVDRNRIPDALDRIRAAFARFAPDHPYRYEFLDEAFNRQYAAEAQQGRLFNVFSVLAVFVAALGLLGLAAFTAERRTKELGIRKVLGASVGGLVAAMIREYLLWIALANLIAWPVGYCVFSAWLNGFANRITLGLADFAAASAAMLLVVLAAVGSRTLRAARANPVESLRYE